MKQGTAHQSYGEHRDADNAPLSRRTRRGPLAFAVYLYRHTPTFRGFVDFAVIGAVVYAFLHPAMLANLSPVDTAHKVITSVPTKLSDVCDLDFIKCSNVTATVPETFVGVRTHLDTAIEDKHSHNAELAPDRGGGGAENTPAHQQAINVIVKVNMLLEKLIDYVRSGRKQSPKLPVPEDVRIDRSLFGSSDAAIRQRLDEAADAYEQKDPARTLVLLEGVAPRDPNVTLLRGMATMALPGIENRKAGFRLLRQAVALGQRQSMTYLGMLMMAPLSGSERNPDQGRDLLEKAAIRGDVLAARVIGMAYLSGWTGTVDAGKAAKFLRMAVDGGDADAAFHLSVLARKGMGMTKDEGEALRLLEVSAKGGVRDGQEALGMYYLVQYGAGWMPSPAPAVEWLSRAAEAGSPSAMRLLAAFYVNIGKGPQWHDPAKTVDYFKRCAAMWYPPCLFGYAAVHHKGVGVKRDLVAAHAYYSLALPDGQVKAKERIEQIEEILTDEQLGDARVLAEQLERQRANEASLRSW